MKGNIDLSVVLPCRNEEKAIAKCISGVNKALSGSRMKWEIVVSDSSSDNSAAIAEKLGAKVVRHGKKGYGMACIEGISAASGKYVVIADADCTYDFNDIPRFVSCLKKGHDFVIGNRLKGQIQKRAMPWHHKHIGNPLLSWILRKLFRTRVRDAHCGIRAATKKALEKMELKATGMEFASEMVIKAAKNRLKIKQIPVNYYRRVGEPHLSSFSDGWRHLRFMLMYAPNFLFMAPGAVLMAIGLVSMAAIAAVSWKTGNGAGYIYPAILGSFLAILGYQIMAMGVHARTYAVSSGFEKNDRFVDFLARFIRFESGLIIGAAVLAASVAAGILIVYAGIGGASRINTLLLALTFGILGIQTMFSAFFTSMLLVDKK